MNNLLSGMDSTRVSSGTRKNTGSSGKGGRRYLNMSRYHPGMNMNGQQQLPLSSLVGGVGGMGGAPGSNSREGAGDAAIAVKHGRWGGGSGGTPERDTSREAAVATSHPARGVTTQICSHRCQEVVCQVLVGGINSGGQNAPLPGLGGMHRPLPAALSSTTPGTNKASTPLRPLSHRMSAAAAGGASGTTSSATGGGGTSTNPMAGGMPGSMPASSLYGGVGGGGANTGLSSRERAPNGLMGGLGGLGGAGLASEKLASAKITSGGGTGRYGGTAIPPVSVGGVGGFGNREYSQGIGGSATLPGAAGGIGGVPPMMPGMMKNPNENKSYFGAHARSMFS